MIDPESKEKMQENSEGPLGCLKSKTVFCNSQDVGNPSQVFPESTVEIHDKSGASTLEYRKSIIRDSSLPPNGAYNKSFYQQQFCMWPTFYPEKVHQNHWNFVESHFYASAQDYPLPVENRMQYVPFKLFSPGHSHDFQCQEFQYFVVIDFEATCDKERIPFPQEIIEFPSVLVNSVTGQLEASFQTYVRPAYHQLLTDFCKELTGIQQIQVDRGVPLSEALLMHDRWLEEKGIKHTNFAVVTWSNWDCRVMLESECKFKRIRKPPYFNRWINLKIPFQEVFGGVRCNLKEAVKLAGLAWEGRAHCGLDDARNTARLLALLMHRGFRFSITNTLMWPYSDSPTPWQPSPDHLPAAFLPQQKLKQLVNPPSLFHSPLENEPRAYCFCGVMSSKRMVRKPGPKHGRHFYGCGNWTVTRGALCPYFEWAS